MMKKDYPPELRELVNKRISLNLLIQGAATHTGFSAHYLVRDELNELIPKIIPYYDVFKIGTFLLG